MLNPTIKRFKQQLDEVLVLRRILLEKQSEIACETIRVDDERMLAFDENMAIEFAFEMNIPVKVEKEIQKLNDADIAIHLRMKI